MKAFRLSAVWFNGRTHRLSLGADSIQRGRLSRSGAGNLSWYAKATQSDAWSCRKLHLADLRSKRIKEVIVEVPGVKSLR